MTTDPRTTRKALGIRTQAELGDLVGISTTYVGMIERGERRPDGATARLLWVLDVPGVVKKLRAFPDDEAGAPA